MKSLPFSMSTMWVNLNKSEGWNGKSFCLFNSYHIMRYHCQGIQRISITMLGTDWGIIRWILPFPPLSPSRLRFCRKKVYVNRITNETHVWEGEEGRKEEHYIYCENFAFHFLQEIYIIISVLLFIHKALFMSYRDVNF